MYTFLIFIYVLYIADNNNEGRTSPDGQLIEDKVRETKTVTGNFYYSAYQCFKQSGFSRFIESLSTFFFKT